MTPIISNTNTRSGGRLLLREILIQFASRLRDLVSHGRERTCLMKDRYGLIWTFVFDAILSLHSRMTFCLITVDVDTEV